jgi:LuxR family maltose regulon positive regulatory protein
MRGELLLHRPRLIATLDQLRADGVALISAPGGYGKTTVLLSWARTRDYPVAIARLRERDNDPTALAATIWAAWTAATAAAPCHANESTPSDLEQLVEVLHHHSKRCPNDHALAIDDAHLAGHALLHRLLDEPFGRLRLLLVCREDAPMPWLRLASNSRLLEIRSTDLAFDADEIGQVLHTLPGLQPTDAVVGALASTTQGWPAGVRIAALAAATASDPVAAITDPGLSRRFARRYFEPEVLRHLPPGTVQFLETTAAVDDLSPALCDVLTDRSDSAEVLLDLADRGIFTVRSIDAHGSFRYHPMFREALNDRLQLRQPDRWTAAQAQASRWYEQEGRPSEAVDYAMRAEEWDRAGQLVAAFSGDALAAGQVSTVAEWIDRLPRCVVRADLALTLIEASVFMVLFDRGRFRDALRQAERLAAPRSAPDDDARPVLLFLRANDALIRGRLPDTVAPLQAALSCFEGAGRRPASLLGPRVNRDSIESALATALLLAGELDEAIAFADRSLAGPAAPNLTAQLRALGTKALALAWQGHESAAVELTLEAQSVLEQSDVESNDPFLVHLAVAWTRSDPGRAHGSLMFVRKLAQRSGLESFQSLSELAAARIALARSNHPAAERAYRDALECLGAVPDPGILPSLAARIADEIRQEPAVDPPALSDRELQILAHLAGGATRGEVADALHLSVDTIKTHLRRAYRKLGVDNRDDALRQAARVGAIPLQTNEHRPATVSSRDGAGSL